MRVVTYGSGPASELIRNHSTDSVQLLVNIGRQSLISAMNGPCPNFGVVKKTAANIERVIQEDFRASLMDHLRHHAESVDLFIWDITDERFGVMTAPDGTYLTRSPQLKKSSIQLSGSDLISFGTGEHFALWERACTKFVSSLRELGLLERTVLLDLAWAEKDETGADASLPYGISPREANHRFQRYVRHLEGLGLRILSERETISSAHHTMGPAPFHYHDSVYHAITAKLHQFTKTAGISNGYPAWNWDDRHKAEIKTWTSPEQIDVSTSGRTEHLLRPRKSKGESFPARFLVENTGSDVLLVISHGALPRAKYTVPRFEWMATLSNREENRLFLSDTTLEKHPDLEVAWFTGNAKDDLSSRYAELVLKAAEQLGASKIIFMGGSGGGYASLHLAAKVPGSRALIFNPQTIIRNYWNNTVEKYQKTLFPELLVRTKLTSLGARVDATLLPRPKDYQVIYVQNDDDALHVDKHLTPFALKNGLPVQSGISQNGNISIILERFAPGHNMPYREVLLDFVDIAISGWKQPLVPWHDLPDSPLTSSYRTPEAVTEKHKTNVNTTVASIEFLTGSTRHQGEANQS